MRTTHFHATGGPVSYRGSLHSIILRYINAQERELLQWLYRFCSTNNKNCVLGTAKSVNVSVAQWTA